MDFRFFESMSSGEAREFLNAYLRLERLAWSDMRDEAQRQGPLADFSLRSIPPVFEWIAKLLRVAPKKLEGDMPWWIKKAPEYQRHSAEFDEPSRVLVLRASYYFGAAFVKEFPALTWATGRLDTAEQNMPVVAGFRKQLEQAPMLVAENLFLRMVADSTGSSVVDGAIRFWSSQVNHRNRERETTSEAAEREPN